MATKKLSEGPQKRLYGENTPAELGLAQKREQAYQLRIRGYSYTQIAEAMTTSPQQAHQMVDAAVRELKERLQESAAKVVELELSRLDAMWQVCHNALENGDVGAVDKMLKIQDRRAKYQGLDAAPKAPQQPEIVSDRVDVIDFAPQIKVGDE